MLQDRWSRARLPLGPSGPTALAALHADPWRLRKTSFAIVLLCPGDERPDPEPGRIDIHAASTDIGRQMLGAAAGLKPAAFGMPPLARGGDFP